MLRERVYTISFRHLLLYPVFFAGLALIVSSVATLLLGPFSIASVLPALLVTDSLGEAVLRWTGGVVLVLLSELGDARTGPEYIVTENGLKDGIIHSLAVQGGVLIIVSSVSIYFGLTGLFRLVSALTLISEFTQLSAIVDAFGDLFKAGLWILLSGFFAKVAVAVDRDNPNGDDA